MRAFRFILVGFICFFSVNVFRELEKIFVTIVDGQAKRKRDG